jgi:ribosomal protein L11 methyltransferase
MQQEYNELQITPTDKIDIFTDFIFEFGIEAIETKKNTLIVRSEEPLEELEWGILEFAKKLSGILGEDIQVKSKLCKKENEDWIKKYKNSITPVNVGRFYIRPTWEKEKEDFINILIDPALSFGTGHHETTGSCLELIGKIVRQNDEFLDVGCGSGILSIAASKLGANVDLCDSDELSVSSAKRNFELNKTVYNDIWIGSANKSEKTYDIVTANIVADVLIMINKDLKNRVKKEGSLILSGILDKYLDNVLAKFDEFELIEVIKKKEWRTLQLRKR